MPHVMYWILGGLAFVVVVGAVIVAAGHFGGTATDSDQKPEEFGAHDDEHGY
jgi:hypothetical protein